MINFIKNKFVIFSIIIFLLVGAGLIWYFSTQKLDLVMLGSKSTVLILASNNDSVKIYDKSDNTIKELNGRSSATLAKFTQQPTTIIFSPDQKKAILYGNIYNPSESYRIYDFAKNLSYKLDSNIRDVSFSPDSSQIAYYEKNDDLKIERILVSNFEVDNAKTIYQLDYDDASLYSISWQGDYITALKNSTIGKPVSMVIIDMKTGKVSFTENSEFYSVANGLYNEKILAVSHSVEAPENVPEYSFGSLLFVDLKQNTVSKKLSKLLVFNNFTLYNSRNNKFYTFTFDGTKYSVYEIDPASETSKLLQDISQGDSLKKMILTQDKKSLILFLRTPITIKL